jgi:glycosyltransferase involved in cell wall biosynthesis
MARPSVLIAHPGRQHSHQLAIALNKADMLRGYWTGVPAVGGPPFDVMTRLMAAASPHDTLPLPPDRVRHHFVAPLLRRVVQGVLPPGQAVQWLHRGYAWFDRWCARQLQDTDAQAVIGYENSALETFRAAKARGLTTILDAASFHHQWQDRFYEYIEPDAVHARINRRKDEEMALADHILTVSEFARQSYIDGGVDPDRVTAVILGCDLTRFERRDRPTAERESTGPPTFVFAGHVSRRKGIDLLLRSSAQIHAEHPHRLHIVGGTDPSLDREAYPWVEWVGRVPQAELADRFRAADALVLPSRHDSFGMVVVEAMATGLPVIVSEHVGAKEIVDDGQTGWVVPVEDVEALAARMREGIEAPRRLHAMGAEAAATAQAYSWDAYHDRVARVVEALVQPRTETPRPTEGAQDDQAGAAPSVRSGASSTKPRVALFTTHPIQYQVPWFRGLHAEDAIDLTVYYEHIPSAKEQGRGFGHPFRWDIPLLDGYAWRVATRDPRHEARRFRSLWRAAGPSTCDAVIVVGWQHAYLRRAALCASLQGRPLIVRGDSNALKPRAVPVQWLHRLYLSMFDRFLVVGEANAAFYRQYGITTERHHACPNAVDNDRFDDDYQRVRCRRSELRAQWDIPADATCYLFAGKFIDKKRPQDVLQAFGRLYHENGESVHLLMVGDGVQRAALQQQAASAGLPVTFTGFLNQTRIGEAYAVADALVLPSDYGETWGLVVNEAMIFETPTIVSDRVGCGPDLVQDGQTGYVVPFGDVEAITTAMRRMAKRPGQRQQMGREARHRVLEHYTVEAAVDGTVNAIHAALPAEP